MRPDARLQRLQPRLGDCGRKRLGEQAEVVQQHAGDGERQYHLTKHRRARVGDVAGGRRVDQEHRGDGNRGDERRGDPVRLTAEHRTRRIQYCER
jgi:hypothetical protein